MVAVLYFFVALEVSFSKHLKLNPYYQLMLLIIEVRTHQHIHHMQVHGNDVGNRADEVLFHAVEDEHCEVGAQAQNYLQK